MEILSIVSDSVVNSHTHPHTAARPAACSCINGNTNIICGMYVCVCARAKSEFDYLLKLVLLHFRCCFRFFFYFVCTLHLPILHFIFELSFYCCCCLFARLLALLRLTHTRRLFRVLSITSMGLRVCVCVRLRACVR